MFVTQVTFTYDNQQFMETNFKSDPYTQVCLKLMLSYHNLILLFCKIIVAIIVIVIFTYIKKFVDMCNRYVPEKLLNCIVKYTLPVLPV